MKKVLVIEASPREGLSARYASRFVESLKARGSCEVELVALRQERIAECRGCCVCFLAGEGRCPAGGPDGDGAERLLAKMLVADGIVLFVPDYALQVPALLKRLFDRLSYVFHRPRLFGRCFMPFVIQGVYGGGKILGYLNELFGFWGCMTLKGEVLPGALRPSAGFEPKVEARVGATLERGAGRFVKALGVSLYPKPSLFRLMIFRMTRSSMRLFPEATEPDKVWYAERGWLESAYYYPVRLGPVGWFVGLLADGMIARMAVKAAKVVKAGK